MQYFSRKMSSIGLRSPPMSAITISALLPQLDNYQEYYIRILLNDDKSNSKNSKFLLIFINKNVGPSKCNAKTKTVYNAIYQRYVELRCNEGNEETINPETRNRTSRVYIQHPTINRWAVARFLCAAETCHPFLYNNIKRQSFVSSKNGFPESGCSLHLFYECL